MVDTTRTDGPVEACLQFEYSMYGSDVNRLTAEQSGANDVKWEAAGDQGLEWQQATIKLNISNAEVVSYIQAKGYNY